MLEFLTFQRVLLIEQLFLGLLVVFLEHSPRAYHRHVALLLLFRHLPLLAHFVLEISIFILHVCHIIVSQQLLERKISSCEALGVEPLLLFLSFTLLLVEFLGSYECGKLSLSHDTCGGPIGRVRIGTVMLSILDLKVGAAHHERVVDFLEGLLVYVLCSVSVLLQGDEQIRLLNILHESLVVQFLGVIGLGLFGLCLGSGFVDDLGILVVNLGLEVESLFVDELDEIEWLLIQLFEDLLIRTLKELMVLLAQNELGGILPGGEAALLQTVLEVGVDQFEKAFDGVSLVDGYGYDQ